MADRLNRVRREDLSKSGDSSWSDDEDGVVDEDLQKQLNAQIAASLGLDIDRPMPKVNPTEASHSNKNAGVPTASQAENAASAPGGEGGQGGHDDLGEFEFRLFSSAGAPSKVILEDDNATLGEGALAHKRPPSFYLASSVPAAIKQQYQEAAVTSEDVLLWSKWPSWGMQLPWKVTKISVTRQSNSSDGTKVSLTSNLQAAGRRRRPGKKKRILTRTREKAKREKQMENAKKAEDKEEHLKEKKKRLNRLKKLRKRAKKKEGEKGEGDAEGDKDSGEGDDD